MISKIFLIVGNRTSLLVCSIGKSVLKDIEAHLVRCGRGLNMSHEGDDLLAFTCDQLKNIRF